ncbi:MAG: hypothetical protein H7Z14_15010 [Anaerolineae bacterium]|nr:hypothetical protein [Phycisphaerae bacterium]
MLRFIAPRILGHAPRKCSSADFKGGPLYLLYGTSEITLVVGSAKQHREQHIDWIQDEHIEVTKRRKLRAAIAPTVWKRL